MKLSNVYNTPNIAEDVYEYREPTGLVYVKCARFVFCLFFYLPARLYPGGYYIRYWAQCGWVVLTWTLKIT